MRRITNRLLIICFLMAWGIAYAQSPGDLAPQSMQMELSSAGKQLESAMADGEIERIGAIVQEIRATLGPYAGIPESKETYVRPVQTGVPDLARAIARWDDVYESLLAKAGSHNPLADDNRIEMREPAYVAIVCLAAAEAGLPNADAYLQRAREELAYLIARQDESGLFPYPADPSGGVPDNVRRQVAELRKRHPEQIRDGLIYLSRPDMQFDVGCAGVALSEGYRVIGDTAYLEAAERAGRWAIGVPLSANWNYNSFSIWLLANLYRATKNEQYLDAALQKTELGVVPGLMENGRWVDQHNAKQSYHFIMVRALSELDRYIPRAHVKRAFVRSKTALAVNARSEDIVRDGVSNTESALWGLAAAVDRQDSDSIRGEALNAVVNETLDQPIGFSSAFLPIYIRYRMLSEDDEQGCE